MAVVAMVRRRRPLPVVMVGWELRLLWSVPLVGMAAGAAVVFVLVAIHSSGLGALVAVLTGKVVMGPLIQPLPILAAVAAAVGVPMAAVLGGLGL